MTDEHCQILRELLGGFKRPIQKLVQTVGWLECLDWFSGSHSNDASDEAFDTFVSISATLPRWPSKLITHFLRQYAQSVVIPQHTPLPEHTVREYFGVMQKATLDSTQVSPVSSLVSPAMIFMN